MTSKFESYRYDQPANPDKRFPKVVNSETLNIAGHDVIVYERPGFAEEIGPILAEIDRQSYHTRGPGEELYTRLVVVTPDGWVGVLGVH